MTLKTKVSKWNNSKYNDLKASFREYDNDIALTDSHGFNIGFVTIEEDDTPIFIPEPISLDQSQLEQVIEFIKHLKS